MLDRTKVGACAADSAASGVTVDEAVGTSGVVGKSIVSDSELAADIS
jgi:hypothetical protein